MNPYRLVLGSMAAVLGLAAIPMLVHGRDASQKEKDLGVKLNVAPELVSRIARQRGATAELLATLPPRRIPSLVRRLEFADLPRERAAFRLTQSRAWCASRRSTSVESRRSDRGR